MRLGFFLGFIIGGGIASLLSRMKEEGAPEPVRDGLAKATESGNPVVDRIKGQVREAREAAREAQLEKEAEMRRELDNLVHRKG